MEASNAQKHFVLVHGACNGAWGWYKIVPLLEAGGHKVTALDLSAAGVDNKHIDEVHTFHDYTLPLLEFMKSLPPDEKVILVGHSLGGLNISLASEKFPHKVSVSVFIGAIMPDTVHPPSYALDQYIERTPADYWSDTQFYASSGKEVLLFGPKILSTKLYQLCSAEDVVLAKMLSRLGSLFREDLSKQANFTVDGFGSVKRVYMVLANHDLAVPEEFQYWQIENTGVSEIKVVKEADHMAMLSSPREVSQCLLEIANNLKEMICKTDHKKHQMEENKAYPSLSFFKILLDSSASNVSIPPDFILRFGERLMGKCKLETNGKWYNVKCEKIDSKHYFTQGWLSFVEANGLKSGYFLVFEWNQETSSFSVSSFDWSQTCSSKICSNKQHLPGSFPASVKREREKDEPIECPEEQRLMVTVPASNKRARVKEEPSLALGISETASLTDSENPSKLYTKNEIEDDDDGFDKGQEDSSDAIWSSLKFSATFKRHNWVAIPKDFAKKTRIGNHRRVVLKDKKGKRWLVDLKPMKDGKLKLTNGWEEFRRASRVDPNVTCIFEFKKRCSNVLKVRVVRGRGRPHKQ